MSGTVLDQTSRDPDPDAAVRPKPLALTDEQLDIVRHAAQVLQWRDRSAFLEAVAARLQGHELGDGLVHRVCAEVQKEFFTPPHLRNSVPRWARKSGGVRRKATV